MVYINLLQRLFVSGDWPVLQLIQQGHAPRVVPVRSTAGATQLAQLFLDAGHLLRAPVRLYQFDHLLQLLGAAEQLSGLEDNMVK